MHPEQAPDHGQLGHAGHAGHALAVFVVDEAGEHLGLAVAQAQRGGGVARAHAVRDRALRAVDLADQVADLEVDLHHHVVVELHAGLDLELQADVDVGHRGAHAHVRRRRGGEHRQLLADLHARLLAVAGAQARVGDERGVARGAAQGGQHGRVGDAGAELAALRPQRAGRRGGDATERVDAARNAVADLGGPLQPEFIETVGRDLHHLDLEQHFGLGQVDGGDQPLGQAHHLGRVANDHQVQALVDEHIARLGHRFYEQLRLLHIGVDEVEAARHQLLVFALLVRCAGVDEHRAVVEQLAVELLGREDHAHRFVERHVLQRDADAHVGAHVLVEREVHV